MATKTKGENSTLSAILQRLDRIEDKLFGNGEALLERVTKLEAAQQLALQRLAEYHRTRDEEIQQTALMVQSNIEKLLETQVMEQKRQNRMQFIGTWIGIIGLAVYMLLR